LKRRADRPVDVCCASSDTRVDRAARDEGEEREALYWQHARHFGL
jgi:hypothetical protein